SANDGGERQGAGDALAATDEIGRYAIVFERPKFAGSTKASLHLVEDEQGIMVFAPGSQILDVLDGREIRANTLVTLGQGTSHGVGRYAAPVNRFEEGSEVGAHGPVAIGKRDLDDSGVFIDNPAFLARDAAGLLGTQGSAV